MGRPKKTKSPSVSTNQPGLRVNIYVHEDMLGSGKMKLLRLVGEKGSISAGAREMGIGYRRAWDLLETLQNCFAEPLLDSRRGGAEKGGSRLTEFGEELLCRHEEFEVEIAGHAQPFLKWIETKQAKR